MYTMEKLNEKNFTQPEKQDKMIDYASKFALGSTLFATLIGVVITIFIVCQIVNK